MNVSVQGQLSKHQLNREKRKLLLRRMLANKSFVIGSLLTLFLIALALFAPLIAAHDPYDMDVVNRLAKPGADHWFGTDNLGRDVFARVVHAAQSSMGVGLSATLITGVLGLAIGLFAAYYKFLDQLLMRICDGLMAVPVILLAIFIVATLGPNIQNLMIALTIVYTPAVARIIRSAALVVKEQTYIEAIRSQGATNSRIIWGHIMPNTLSPLIVQATFIFADAVILEAALSFFGAGVPAPTPSWGNIIYDGKSVIYNAWWMTVFPGAAIILCVLGLNLFGDGLRDLMDPHAAKK